MTNAQLIAENADLKARLADSRKTIKILAKGLDESIALTTPKPAPPATEATTRPVRAGIPSGFAEPTPSGYLYWINPLSW